MISQGSINLTVANEKKSAYELLGAKNLNRSGIPNWRCVSGMFREHYSS